MKEDKQTLAVTVEVLNKKLDEIINNQKYLEKELQKNNKAIMQRINKVQEYNEIDDMRCKIISNQLNAILKKLSEINQKMY